MGHYPAPGEGASGLTAASTGEPDTIAAVATPPGRGGVGVVRVSGPRARAVSTGLLGGIPPPRRASLRAFRDEHGEPIDHGIALFFPSPASFTGEDVLEVQGHGGPVVLDLIMARVLGLGARPARPGEFTERAFLNGKLDLAQAEAVADLIDSATAAAVQGARRTLEGALSTRVHSLAEVLNEVRAHVEAFLDFPEDDLDLPGDPVVLGRLVTLTRDTEAVLAEARQGRVLRDGLRVVVAGRPNVGKSSLLNALVGQEAAIVTDVPGTTRDPVRVEAQVDGLPLHLIDTAGLRETLDPVERIGVDRARAMAREADLVLLVVDGTLGYRPEDQEIAGELPPGLPTLIVSNKVDLTGQTPGAAPAEAGLAVLRVSALTGTGLDDLRQALKSRVGVTQEEGLFSARRRHVDALRRVLHHLAQARRSLEVDAGAELVAEELRGAQTALSEITGRVTSADLLARIFSEFCIGK